MLMPLLVLAVLVQEPAAPKPELSVISAKLGTCSADFTVKDADGKPSTRRWCTCASDTAFSA
jgi:hypothetical protein